VEQEVVVVADVESGNVVKLLFDETVAVHTVLYISCDCQNRGERTADFTSLPVPKRRTHRAPP
jgi:hypothetical protein